MGTRRHRETDANDAGQDSFLDIVANIVGVLIILVMVMGVRAKHAPITMSVPNPEQEAAKRALEKNLAVEGGLHASVLETTAKTEQLERARQIQDQTRSRLGLLTTAAQKIIEKRRAELDTVARDQFDQQRKLAEARDELASIENQYDLVSRIEPKATEIKNYPTPLSKTVNGHEVHLQLRGGRVTVIPWDTIISELKAAFDRNVGRMRTRPELTAQTHPIGGFRVRYTIRQYTVSMRTYEQTGRGGGYISLDKFTLLPVSEQMGAPLSESLSAGSELSDALALHRPERTTVTVWVYPDSFADYRKLKEKLYHLGYRVAAWPRREGELIGGSPRGSRSAAQ